MKQLGGLMLSNSSNQKLSSLLACLITCLFMAVYVGSQMSPSEPVSAEDQPQNSVQLEISVERRVGWTEEWAEYRVRLDNRPRNFGLRETTIQYKVVDQQTQCGATASWSQNLPRNHRNIILDKWKTKPNYLFLVKDSVLNYLGKKFCFKISKAAGEDMIYLDGYAEIEIEKWWTDVESGGVCPDVYTWIEDATITRGGMTTLHWKITNVRHPDSTQITARNHDYWFYDTSQAEPNIKKAYGNPYEVTSSYDAATNTITASRTVVGHLAPRTENLYVIKVHQSGYGCPSVRDAVFMRVID